MEVQYPLFLKILAFDRELPRRAGAEIVIGVVYQERVRPSWLAKDDFLRVMRKSQVHQVKGLPVRAVAIPLDGDTKLDEAVRKADVDVFYVAPLRAYDIDGIVSLAQRQKILTLTGVPEYVKTGLSVGLGLTADTPEILVNLQAAKNEGADFHASLLRLAKVARK